MFKQAVTSEDMFLQMGNKTPGSASCEDMVVSFTQGELRHEKSCLLGFRPGPRQRGLYSQRRWL